MAWVYQAKDLVASTDVAVKVLYPHYNRDTSYVERFLREAQLALRIPDEHIVRILAYGMDHGQHYLVMELIQGKDLATLLCERGKQPWRYALEIGIQVGQALEAANAQRVVHRDIKPQNIMLTQEGSVKVLDFGIARARQLPSVTQGGFVGSPSYISPEQGMGKQVDARSDIYSLGIVLYEMICGAPPFDASTPWSIINQHIAQKPPPLNIEGGQLPPSVEALVLKMLAKAPEDRFQTPRDLLEAMVSLLEAPVDADAPHNLSTLASQATTRDRAHELLLSGMYQRALEAAQSEEWPQAVNLLQQILKVDPGYRDVAERLAYAGRQARLAALYRAAQEALDEGRWQEAVDELGEIVSADANYRDSADLLTRAGLSLAAHKTQQRLPLLYKEGQAHYQNHEWHHAALKFAQIVQADAGFRDAAQLSAASRRLARWSRSFLGRTGRSLAQWLGGTREPDQPANEPRNEEYT
jgi:tetratricopeptide (TPR) repeat protein